MQHTFGYARAPAANQNPNTQLDDLTRAGCTRFFREKVLGTRTRSPALDELLARVREGDVVAVNRLARNTMRIMQLVQELKQNWTQKLLQLK